MAVALVVSNFWIDFSADKRQKRLVKTLGFARRWWDGLGTRTLIGWMGLMGLCATTIGIAVDQIHTRDATIRDLEAAKKEAESSERDVKKRLAKVIATTEEYAQASLRSIEEMKDLGTEAVASTGKIAVGMIEENGRLEARVQDLERQLTAYRRVRPNGPAPAPTEVTRVRTAPSPAGGTNQPSAWRLEMNRKKVAAAIRQEAERKWGTDFSMVKHAIEKDTAAYEELIEWSKNRDKTVRDIIGAALERWGTDYSMVVYEIKKQVEALQELNGRR